MAEIDRLVRKRRQELGIKPDGKRPVPKTVGAKLQARVDAITKLTHEEIEQRNKRRAEEALADQGDKRQQQWQALCRLRGERYAECRLSNYEATTDKQQAVLRRLMAYRDSLWESVKAGRNIMLFGPAGTGKDHLLMALAGAAIANEGFSVEWRSVMDWFGDVRDSFDSDQQESQLVLGLCRPDILMLSDPLPPLGNLTPFQANMLFRVVDRRYSMLKPTWVTVNCKSGGEAVERMTKQIVDRLSHDAVALFCDWESYRTQH